MVKRYNPDTPLRSRLSGLLLFFMPIPLLPAAMIALAQGKVIVMTASLIGLGLVFLAAVLTRKGILLDQESRMRKLQRRRGKLHYRLLSGMILATATALIAWFCTRNGLIVSLAYGLVALLGYYLYYGLDETRSSPDFSAIGVTAEEVIEAIDKAEQKLEDIELARKQMTDISLKRRLKTVIHDTRKILDIIEDDPRDLRRARKFLTVYLEGMRKVTKGYAALHNDNPQQELKDNFSNVLTTIESVVSEQQTKLLENDAMELDVQIEVLELQLKKEGVL
ncbi:MAG: 5-bromo-4-chloroindolyl phosphate hydrolysis family protein [Gammaproteobacteria bacterium]|nr:5-bromo-4-chloroindolyl phosphate hydrolysis family protein [Gammaproteobacteria bacterium]